MARRNNISLVAMDLDGTLTQHKSPLEPGCRAVLEELSKHYRLLMVCAGGCERVYKQLEEFPTAISGFYGMQYSEVRNGRFTILENESVLVDRETVELCGRIIREEFQLFSYEGAPVEFHASGLITFPILGTKASLDKKLAYDPDRSKRRACYKRVCEIFDGYNVFIGGSSSFDIAPKPYSKLYALDRYLAANHLKHDQVVFFGDDYGIGGNDRDIYMSDIPFIQIDDYRDFPRAAKNALL